MNKKDKNVKTAETVHTHVLKRNEKGITLVALLITIIILILLVAITIKVIFDIDFINLASQSTTNYAEEQGKEKNVVNELGETLKDTINKINGAEEEEKEEPMETIVAQFKKEYGVIDIIWIDTNNKQINTPISPASSLGGLEAIKYNETEWVPANTSNTGNDWYNYEEQIGNTEEKGTSKWANARSKDQNAYFVWIPRYAYKITYFQTKEDMEAYRNDRTSISGIIGYSTIRGMVDVTTGSPKLVEGTEPTNVIGKVKTKEYSDYIPHPAFEFNGAKSGIWVGKFESSGDSSKITIIPDIESIHVMTASAIFEVCRNINKIYGLTSDSHMMKNIEWGAVAYLTESKYGRNGTEVAMNNKNDITGEGNYKEKFLQSTTGNIYGIYDMNGGASEVVSAYINNNNASSNRNITNLLSAESKYVNVYLATNNSVFNNYNENKGMKGDAVYEITDKHTGAGGWHGDLTNFPASTGSAFQRGR